MLKIKKGGCSMKRILSIMLAVIFTIGTLAGCGADKAATESTTVTKTETSASTASTASTDNSTAKKELRKVKMVFPRTIEVLEDTPFWVAKNLGYFEEEGLDVTMEQSFGTTDIKMVATGNADFAAPGTSFVLAGIEEGLDIKVVSAYDAINIWGMCTLKDSKIKSWEDMKDAKKKYGKKLTVALGDAAWEMLVTPTIIAAGVDPKEDLEFVVAGENRYIQVSEGKLDMLFSWPGEAWQLMGQGFNFDYIDGNDVLKTCSNPIITNTNLINNEPEVVKGFLRGLAKGMYFTRYNPEAAAAVVCKQFPAIDISWNAAVYVQKGRAYQMFGPEGGADEAKMLENIGMSFEDKWNLVMDSTVESKAIKASIPLDKVYTNEFIDGTWDRKAIEADADNYDVASIKAKYKP